MQQTCFLTEVLHNFKTCSENLQLPAIKEFWAEIASFVARDDHGYGGRIDLLGCRVSEFEEQGGRLLMDLWNETGVRRTMRYKH